MNAYKLKCRLGFCVGDIIVQFSSGLELLLEGLCCGLLNCTAYTSVPFTFHVLEHSMEKERLDKKFHDKTFIQQRPLRDRPIPLMDGRICPFSLLRFDEAPFWV